MPDFAAHKFCIPRKELRTRLTSFIEMIDTMIDVSTMSTMCPEALAVAKLHQCKAFSAGRARAARKRPKEFFSSVFRWRLPLSFNVSVTTKSVDSVRYRVCKDKSPSRRRATSNPLNIITMSIPRCSWALRAQHVRCQSSATS